MKNTIVFYILDNDFRNFITFNTKNEAYKWIAEMKNAVKQNSTIFRVEAIV